MDDESLPRATTPRGPSLRHSLNDVTAARLRGYHHECNRRLEITLRLFRDRQERYDRDHHRLSRSPRTLPRPEVRRTTFSSPLTPVDARPWKLLRESSDIRVYRLKTRQERTSTVHAIGTVHGALEDVMNGLYADSTRTARVLEMLLSPRSLDARVLHVDKSSTETKPFQFSGIVWMALKLPGLGLCRHRDFLCFKKMDLVKNDMGEEMGYMVLHSIDPLAHEVAVSSFDAYASTGATWPPLSQAHNQTRSRSSSSIGTGSDAFVRGFISLAIVFKRAGDDRVDMFAHGQFNPSGRLPPILGDNCIAEWLTSIANTVQSGQAKNLSLLLAVQKQSFNDQTSSRQRCGVCARALFFWDASRNCRGCWKPCCRICCVTKPIFCAHYHPNRGSAAGGPCTETFCLACVCTVIPSGATINARLLKRLAKKRKQAPTFSRLTMTASSVTDGSIPQQQLQSMTPSEGMLAVAEISSISALSSRESEKHQQHRLSIGARPKKRAFVQPPDVACQEDGQNEGGDTDADATSIMLEVLEHYKFRRGGTASVISGMSSSNAGTSLRSFTSADLGSGSTNHFNTLQLRRYPSGHSLLTHNQSFRQRIPASLVAASATARQGQVPLERCSFQAQSSFWLPHQSVLAKKAKESSPPLDEEYYQRLLQNYLLHTNSSRSLLSRSSYNGMPTMMPQPPISQESNVLWEHRNDARAAINYSMPGGSPDVVTSRRFK